MVTRKIGLQKRSKRQMIFGYVMASSVIAAASLGHAQTLATTSEDGQSTPAAEMSEAPEAATVESVDSVIDGLLSGVSDQIEQLRDAMIALEADISEKAAQIGNLETQIADKDDIIAALESDIADNLESSAALTVLLDEKDAFIAELRSALGEGEGALEGLGTKYEEALAEISRLSQEAAAGAAALADLATMTDERDSLNEQLSTLQELANTTQSELANALSAVSELEAAQAEAASATEALTRMQEAQKAVEHQRFWLAILIAILIVAIGYLLLRGRKESRASA